MDSMHIEVPSGKVYLNGHRVFRVRLKPYIIDDDGKQVLLNDSQKKMARDMVKFFAPMIDYLNGTLEESLYE